MEKIFPISTFNTAKGKLHLVIVNSNFLFAKFNFCQLFHLCIQYFFLFTIIGWPAGTGSCGGGSPERDSGIVQVQRGGEEERRGITGAGETTASHGEGERRNGRHMGHGYVCNDVCMCIRFTVKNCGLH